MLADLETFVATHRRFADWERARHRADFVAKLGFPDSHPLRHIVDALSNGLDDCRWSAEVHLAKFAQQHGEIRGIVNGWYFSSTNEWFERGERYWDCPRISFGRGAQRSKMLDLVGIASLHDLEITGNNFMAAVDALREKSKKRKLTHTQKSFSKGVTRLEKQLKRVKVYPQEKVGVLLSLRRAGLPTETGRIILGFLL